jgi:hypothetical protein
LVKTEAFFITSTVVSNKIKSFPPVVFLSDYPSFS